MSDYCDCMCDWCLKQDGEHRSCQFYECSDELFDLNAGRLVGEPTEETNECRRA